MNWLFYSLTDWRVIALSVILLLFWLKLFHPKTYSKLWHNLKFNYKIAFIAFVGIVYLIFREMTVYPFNSIVATWPTLPSWAHIILYGDLIHFRSILVFGVLILALWRKYEKMLPALAVGWFCIGIIEATFILQHFVGTPGRFLGWYWYLPFFGGMIYFLDIRKSFRLRKNFWYFFVSAIFVQYLLLLFYPFWLVKYTVRFEFVVNSSVLPNPPIQTWIFWFLNHLMKTLFAVAFYFMELVKDDG